MKISDKLKEDVPDHIKERAREMARQELERRLEELNMSMGDARGYGELLTAVQAHITTLHDLLERMLSLQLLLDFMLTLDPFRPCCQGGRTRLG